MARPEGLNHFCNFLKGLEAQYVIIGGGAAAVLLELQGLPFRATKDVDLVILTNTSKDLNKRISEYVRAGKYQTREATEGEPKYYRFSKPESKDYPAIIEIFARNEQQIDLGKDQHIIPIEKSASAQLSAVLLDDEYFGLIQTNIIESPKEKIPLINAIANICLKARAHRELSEREAKGDTNVDKKDIRKHLKDILRIAQTLTGSERQTLGRSAKKDLSDAISKLSVMEKKEFKTVMQDYPGADLDLILKTLRTIFSL